MKYSDAVSFRIALETRLNAAAVASQTISASRLRKLVTLERFLARLLEAAPGRWVIKGGVALEFRVPDRARATKDLDLWMTDNEESATDGMVQATLVDLHDYFSFSIERAGRIDADQEGLAIRFRVRAEVAGRQFEIVVVDIGFGEALTREPDLVTGCEYLAIADIAPIAVPTLPLDVHVAEKLHAYTRLYTGMLGSSRVKDLIDLVLISSFAEFSAGELRQSMESSFASRGSHPLPMHLPLPPDDWVTAYRKLAEEVEFDANLMAGHHIAANFLDPVLTGGVRDDARWDPVRGHWRGAEDDPLDRTSFQRDDETFARFSAMLDTPRAPSAALRHLLRSQAPWE